MARLFVHIGDLKVIAWHLLMKPLHGFIKIAEQASLQALNH